MKESKSTKTKRTSQSKKVSSIKEFRKNQVKEDNKPMENMNVVGTDPHLETADMMMMESVTNNVQDLQAPDAGIEMIDHSATKELFEDLMAENEQESDVGNGPVLESSKIDEDKARKREEIAAKRAARQEMLKKREAKKARIKLWKDNDRKCSKCGYPTNFKDITDSGECIWCSIGELHPEAKKKAAIQEVKDRLKNELNNLDNKMNDDGGLEDLDNDI